jgi:hypothetical protein
MKLITAVLEARTVSNTAAGDSDKIDKEIAKRLGTLEDEPGDKLAASLFVQVCRTRNLHGTQSYSPGIHVIQQVLQSRVPLCLDNDHKSLACC